MSKKTTSESALDLSSYITTQTGQEGQPNSPAANIETIPSEKPKKRKVKMQTPARAALSDDFAGTLVENFIRYDRISGQCLPVTIPVDVSERLQEFVRKYRRRLSARSIVTALVETFISGAGDEVMGRFLDRIHYIPPTEEELAAREKNAKRAREQRTQKDKAD